MQGQKNPIVVVGAGIVGVSTALHLQRMGERVLLLDRQGPAAGTSYGNAGILACSAVVPVVTPGIMSRAPKMLMDENGPLFMRWSYLPRMLPFLQKYIASSKNEVVEHIARGLQPLLADGLEQHQDISKGSRASEILHPSTYLYLYRDKAGFEGDAYGWNLRRENGYSWETAEGGEVREIEPDLNDDYRYAVLLKNHGFIHKPGNYVQALTDTFLENGGDLRIGTVVDISENNDGLTVELKQGDRLAAHKVVLATGVWSNELAQKIDVTVPMETERGYHIELDNPSVMPRNPLMDASGKFVVTPMGDSIRFAGVVEFGGLEAPQSEGPLALLKRGAKNLLPDLELTDVREWLGHRPAPADSLPILGHAPKNRNIILAYGHHHIGMTAGPKTGLLAAQLAAGRKPDIDLSAYAPDRTL
ncbi:NAD(P)/FAD-dependent oxidoreductase [Kiloniella sp. b19]|uniref:NAD(P)/FAD-dependent oxidoreductase n=1 Tax=Kiloniella sp. GXU_MW_B19 TaxID=3141326 RepID=UPI0031DEABB5